MSNLTRTHLQSWGSEMDVPLKGSGHCVFAWQINCISTLIFFKKNLSMHMALYKHYNKQRLPRGCTRWRSRAQRWPKERTIWIPLNVIQYSPREDTCYVYLEPVYVVTHQAKHSPSAINCCLPSTWQPSCFFNPREAAKSRKLCKPW